MKRRRIYDRGVIDVPLPQVETGAMDYWPAESPAGHCRLCGCPPQRMPMIFRGTGWCSENHRKELEIEEEA